ncbi:MAG: protein phosphatase 2C domain-containing protein [Rhizobacter sp.]
MSMVTVSPWAVIGRSARGATHARDGLPNQDAVAHVSTAEGEQPALALAAVADGHGGRRHFRSAEGARLAVDVALRVLHSVAPRFAQMAPSTRSDLAASEVPTLIVNAWVEAVRAHLSAHPITDEEWLALESAEGPDGSIAVRADPLLAYGATLLAALTTADSVALWQLGDGDVLAVSPAGVVSRPVASDERLFGNFTTSICRPGAAADFRSAVLTSKSTLPSLLMLSTDGYANSFRTDADFLKVGTDLRDLISQHGLTAIEARLGGILEDASANGSGDDITVALLYQGSAAAPAAPLSMRAPAAVLASGDVSLTLAAAKRRIARLRSVVAVLLLALLAVALWWRQDRTGSQFPPHDEPVLGAPIAWEPPASGVKPSIEVATPKLNPQEDGRSPQVAKPMGAASAANAPRTKGASHPPAKKTPEPSPY